MKHTFCLLWSYTLFACLRCSTWQFRNKPKSNLRILNIHFGWSFNWMIRYGMIQERVFSEVHLHLLEKRRWKCIKLQLYFNSFMTKVPIIQKPVHWFALQISVLVSIWTGPPPWKSSMLTEKHKPHDMIRSFLNSFLTTVFDLKK